MKKDLVIFTHTPIDYDSRIIKQVKFFSEEYHVILYSRLLKSESLEIFEGYDVEVCVIPDVPETKIAKKLLEDYLKIAYEKSFRHSIKKHLKKMIHMNYTFTELYYLYKPINSWCRKDFEKKYKGEYSNVAAILINDITLLHAVGRLKLSLDKAGYNIPVVSDLHEAHFEYKAGGGFEQYVSLELLKRNLKNIDIICAPSKKILNGYFNIGVKFKDNLKRSVVYNSSNYENLLPKKKDGTTKLVHVGIAARDRKLERMIEAMEHLDDEYELFFHLVTTNSSKAHIYIEELIEYAKELNISSRVHFLEPIEPEQLVSTLNDYDIGLFYLEPSEKKKNFNYAAPNKLFQYVQARIAVVVTDIGEMGTIVRDYNVGTVASFSVEDFAKKIVDANSSLDYYKENSNEAASELSAEEQWKDVSKYIREYNKI